MPTQGHSTSLPTTEPTDSSPERRASHLYFLVDGASVVLVPGERLLTERAVPVGATVVLLHGAGSGTDVPVLRALRDRLVATGVDVATIDMPYRVAGRRAPDRPARLDAVLRAAVVALGDPRPLALAGRSMGSRVACRCARELSARGVLALGFPLNPPGARPSRLPELLGAGVAVLVVQGSRDSFGMPQPDPARELSVHVVPGADHSLRRRKSDPGTSEEAEDIAVEVGARWLVERLAAAGNP